MMFNFTNHIYRFLNFSQRILPFRLPLISLFFTRRDNYFSLEHGKSLKYPAIMKIDTPVFKKVLTPELEKLLKLFKKYNYEIRIAGGAVRDILLGNEPKDVDFATNATPDQMKEMFELEEIRMINMKGEKHGTITARINEMNFEVTTLRIDVVTDGRHAEVKFTTDWEVDANRRDLTINSMFLGEDGIVYDYFGGYEDLMKKNVVFVGDPATRIQEDYLRILRYFRFYGRIAESPDKHNVDTLNAIKENVSGLKNISGERLWLELSKILTGNFANRLLLKIIDVGASPFLGLPESPNIEELNDVWKRGHHLQMEAITVLVSIMSNRETFMKFHERCKLSVFNRDLGLFIIDNRDKEATSSPLRPYQALMYKTIGKLSDIRLYVIELLKYKGEAGLLREFEDWKPPVCPINGHVLKKRGYKGKEIGLILNQLRLYWLENDFKPTEEELVSLLPEEKSELSNNLKQNVNGK